MSRHHNEISQLSLPAQREMVNAAVDVIIRARNDHFPIIAFVAPPENIKGVFGIFYCVCRSPKLAVISEQEYPKDVPEIVREVQRGNIPHGEIVATYQDLKTIEALWESDVHSVFRLRSDKISWQNQTEVCRIVKECLLIPRPLFLHVPENPMTLVRKGKWKPEFCQIVCDTLWWEPIPREITNALRKVSRELRLRRIPMISDRVIDLIRQNKTLKGPELENVLKRCVHLFIASPGCDESIDEQHLLQALGDTTSKSVTVAKTSERVERRSSKPPPRRDSSEIPQV